MQTTNSITACLPLRDKLIAACVLGVLVISACGLSLPAASTPTPSPFPPQATLVSLTFDDGNADNYPVAAVLKQYGLHATFYIPSGLVGSKDI